MKKFLCCLGAVLGVAYAQAQDVSVGAKLGANVASAWSAGNNINGGVVGVHAGAVINSKITRKHAVQAELLYSTKGFSSSATQIKNGVTVTTDQTVNLNYLELPVLYQYLPGHSKNAPYSVRMRKSGFYFMAGPQLSVNLGAKAKAETTVKNGDEQETFDSDAKLKQYTNNFDISAVAGVGYNFTNKTTFSVRYALGLKNIQDVNNPFVPEKAKNGTLQIGVGYLLPVKI